MPQRPEDRLDHPRIVITGLGVVAPNGIGREEFWRNCAAGVSGIKRISLFDTSSYRCHWAGEVHGFQPEAHLGSKGLRNLDRTTLLSLVAAKLALEDSGLQLTDANRGEIGVVLGSTMGSVHSISEFDKEGLREGPRYVNPARFPNTVINSPASQVAIRFGLKGLNATIATGFTASLDALSYAVDMLRLGRAQALLVGGVEELCPQTYLGFYKLGFLAASKNGSAPAYEPMGRQPEGTLLGEGAVFLALETEANARARGASLLAEVLACVSLFDAASMFRYDQQARGAVTVVQQALAQAGLAPKDVDMIASSANATPSGDVAERHALETVFGARLAEIVVDSPKGLLGETFSAAGMLALAAGLGAARSNGRGSRHLLVQGLGPAGIGSAVIVKLTDIA